MLIKDFKNLAKKDSHLRVKNNCRLLFTVLVIFDVSVLKSNRWRITLAYEWMSNILVWLYANFVTQKVKKVSLVQHVWLPLWNLVFPKLYGCPRRERPLVPRARRVWWRVWSSRGRRRGTICQESSPGWEPSVGSDLPVFQSSGCRRCRQGFANCKKNMSYIRSMCIILLGVRSLIT